MSWSSTSAGAGGGAGAVFRRGVSRGAVSRPFSPGDVVAAAQEDHVSTMLVDVESQGSVRGGAEVAARARLAPHVHAANVLVTCARQGVGEGALQLVVPRGGAPHEEVLLWFAEPLAAALHLPFLTLRNIRGRREYVCEECGAQFEEPNPLKLHLFMRCAPLDPRRMWRTVAARLARPEPCASAEPLPSAFRRVSPAPATVAHVSVETQAEGWAARLEAWAAEWGRARGGHACLYCGKLYSRKYGLKIHLRTHTGYRPLRCRHCARAFGDPSNLNKHVRLHATGGGGGGGGAHACSRCGKALARRRDLERHMRSHCAPPAPAPPCT